ncbi:MAG: hypothetical protein QF415_01210 [Candidatus Undinarchaeales archaeon]|nr:hypothetical protein [Candidatus Undinarchaeales archaeon]MDP7493270.1 hypothetical protein [Candidatus Undinarchaeales archaeon]
MLTRVERMRLQLRAVGLLRYLKDSYTYSFLADVTGLDITVLNRYVKGRVVPSEEKARELIRVLGERFPLAEAIRHQVVPEPGDSVDLSLLGENPALLVLVADDVAGRFQSHEVDLVVTCDSAALAIQIAARLNARSAIAVLGEDGKTLILRRRLVRPDDDVLIVDNVTDSGAGLHALKEAVQHARGQVLGAVVPVATTLFKRPKGTDSMPVRVMVEV